MHDSMAARMVPAALSQHGQGGAQHSGAMRLLRRQGAELGAQGRALLPHGGELDPGQIGRIGFGRRLLEPEPDGDRAVERGVGEHRFDRAACPDRLRRGDHSQPGGVAFPLLHELEVAGWQGPGHRVRGEIRGETADLNQDNVAGIAGRGNLDAAGADAPDALGTRSYRGGGPDADRTVGLRFAAGFSCRSVLGSHLQPGSGLLQVMGDLVAEAALELAA
jgi:hypothetical protein